MAHVTIPNSARATNADHFSGIWKLAQGLIKAGYIYKASSDGSAKDTTGAITASKWGAPAAVGGQTGAVASITTKLGDDVTLTGVTGLVAPTASNQGGSEGRFLTISGAASAGNNGTFQIVEVLSATSCRVRNASAVASDANNGAITWTEKDPLGIAYVVGSYGQGSWIVLQGASMLKVPFTVAPVGAFLRGENVTQTTTGAQGEVVGVTFDPGTGAGYLVIAPRLSGSGAARRGWNQDSTATYVITGGTSAATVNPNGTIIEYVQQTVIEKDNGAGTHLTSGAIYHQCIDVVGETASAFSTLAGAAGCTATIQPGGGGTGNAFPATGSWVPHGSATSQTGTVWWRTNFSGAGTFGNFQILIANCIERTSVSADGSFVWSEGQNSSALTVRSNGGFAFQRLDNSEDGDVNPYVWFTATSTVTYGSRSRTAETGVVDNEVMWRAGNMLHTARGSFTGWRRRGLSSEAFMDPIGAVLGTGAANSAYAPILQFGAPTTDPEKVATAAAGTLVTEPIWVVGVVQNAKCRKGTLRWMRMADGNTSLDTYDTKKWLILDTFSTSNFDISLLLGPWDQSTTPVQ